jgi:hypothetical protein
VHQPRSTDGSAKNLAGAEPDFTQGLQDRLGFAGATEAHQRQRRRLEHGRIARRLEPRAQRLKHRQPGLGGGGAIARCVLKVAEHQPCRRETTPRLDIPRRFLHQVRERVSAGLGIPFVIAAFAMKPFITFLRRMKSRFGMIEKAMGALLVLTGIAFLTGGMELMAFWLLETFPVLGSLG